MRNRPACETGVIRMSTSCLLDEDTVQTQLPTDTYSTLLGIWRVYGLCGQDPADSSRADRVLHGIV